MTIKSKGFLALDRGFMIMLQAMYDDFENGANEKKLEYDLDKIQGFVAGLMHSDILTIQEYSMIWDALTNTYCHMVYGTTPFLR